ncbi:MAG TPA: HAMP domain-containing sensor histidine kinase [Polyangia bacterium]|nr:HAMP domain-containing sensor histidine kinase [Polyangia bacterium]
MDSPTDETVRLSRSLELLRRLLDGDRCSLLFFNDEGERALVCTPPAAPGEASLLKARLARLLLADDPGAKNADDRARHELALPVVGLDEVLGALLLERRGAGERELRLFSLVAAQLGAYLTMLRLHRQAVELDRFKREMFAVIVHDLKNPMAAIMGTVHYLAHDLREAPEDVRAGLADVQSACNRIQRLVANLLDLARLEERRMPLHPAALALAEILAELVGHRRASAKARGTSIAIVGMDDGLRVTADPDLLARVIENILDNAVRYTGEGDRIELWATAARERLVLRIGNTGPPIPASALSTIFEKFGQASKGGRMNLGLGLYFARLAMEAHGGRIWLERTDALPTIFAIELPWTSAGSGGSTSAGRSP